MIIAKKPFFFSYPFQELIQFALSLEVTLLQYLQAINLISYTHYSNSSVKTLFAQFSHYTQSPNSFFCVCVWKFIQFHCLTRAALDFWPSSTPSI